MYKDTSYKVTAMVSLYNAERFVQTCLENLVAQSIFPHMEIIIIDACSPQNEYALIKPFLQKYPNILYERTAQRETLYASWNRALKMARGTYITNANADDRHAPNALEILANALDTHPEVALVYGNSRVTAQENATFSHAPVTGRLLLPTYSHMRLLYACLAGPQPMWRRAVHEEVGYFEESFIIAGDYDMWLRISERYPFLHIPKMLGLFLSYEHNLAKSDTSRLQSEEDILYTRALKYFFSQNFTPHTPFAHALDTNEHFLKLLLDKQKHGKAFSLQELEFHWYAKALLLVKLGQKHAALDILQPFLALGQRAAKMCHLYHFIQREWA